MDFTDLRDLSLDDTHTNANDYSETSSLRAANLVYQNMVDKIVVNTKWDYFWDTWLSDTVVNQSEYVAEKLGIAPDDLDIKKINKVFVKYSSTDTYPTLLKYQAPTTLEKHPDYYKANQPSTSAFFYIQDNSIFIYPAPTEAVTGGLELFVIHKPAAITESTTEAEIEIPSQFHSVLVLWMMEYIYKSQWKLNEAQLVKSEYNAWIREMISYMKQRYNQKRTRNISWLDEYR